MALRRIIWCTGCQQDREVWCGSGDWPTTCSECSTKALQDKRAEHLAGLLKLPLEERLAKLEAWAYDYEQANAWVLNSARIAHTRF